MSNGGDTKNESGLSEDILEGTTWLGKTNWWNAAVFDARERGYNYSSGILDKVLETVPEERRNPSVRMTKECWLAECPELEPLFMFMELGLHVSVPTGLLHSYQDVLEHATILAAPRYWHDGLSKPRAVIGGGYDATDALSLLVHTHQTLKACIGDGGLESLITLSKDCRLSVDDDPMQIVRRVVRDDMCRIAAALCGYGKASRRIMFSSLDRRMIMRMIRCLGQMFKRLTDLERDRDYSPWCAADLNTPAMDMPAFWSTPPKSAFVLLFSKDHTVPDLHFLTWCCMSNELMQVLLSGMITPVMRQSSKFKFIPFSGTTYDSFGIEPEVILVSHAPVTAPRCFDPQLSWLQTNQSSLSNVWVLSSSTTATELFCEQARARGLTISLTKLTY